MQNSIHFKSNDLCEKQRSDFEWTIFNEWIISKWCTQWYNAPEKCGCYASNVANWDERVKHLVEPYATTVKKHILSQQTKRLLNQIHFVLEEQKRVNGIVLMLE